jgi:hypothetical protein
LKLLTCIHQILRKEGCLCWQLCGSHKGLAIPLIFIIWWSKYMLCLWCFKGFKDLVASKHDTIGLCWVVKALDITDSRVEYLTIYIANHTFLAIYVDPFFGNFNWVTQNVFDNIVKEVKIGEQIK